jgi:hypothetical protein
MKVKLLRAIPHYKAGDIVEMTEDQAKAYGKNYVEPVKTSKKEEKEDEKDQEPESKNEKTNETDDIGDAAKNTALLTTNATK